MATVKDINEAFAQKGLHIALPLAPELPVRSVEILEKKPYPGGVAVLLSVRYSDEQGKEVSNLFFLKGDIEIKRERKPPVAPSRPVKEGLLPQREKATFDSEEEALKHLRAAIKHLLEDKGYKLQPEGQGADLCLRKGDAAFYVDFSLRLDEAALARAEELVKLRGQYGPDHDYGLVVPAFQEALGLPLRLQEAWVGQHQEYLSAHRIGVYGVDNLDPNRLYPFTVYPRPKELMRYFLYTAQQWSFVRSRWVESRDRG